MPYKEFVPEKIYYTIREVAEMLGENISLVRFWADKFPQIVKPARNAKGNRLFTAKDVKNLKIIHYLVKERGMTLDGVAKRFSDNQDGVDRTFEVVSRLNDIRTRLLQVYESL